MERYSVISLANVALDGEVFYRAWLGDIPWVGGKHAYIGELGRLGVLHRKRGVTNGNFVDIFFASQGCINYPSIVRPKQVF